MINKLYNILKYLTIFYQFIWECSTSNYKNIINKINIYKASSLSLNINLHFLNPDLFLKLFIAEFIKNEDVLIMLSHILNKL